MTVRAEAQAVLVRQEQSPAGRVHGRHGPLTKDPHILLRQTEVVVLSQVLARLRVGGRAGHQVQRNGSAGCSRARQNLFKQNLKQRNV